MRVLPERLAQHLESGATTLARCWRLTRIDGVRHGFTDHDADIVFDGLKFSALDGLSASGDVTKSGLAVGGLEISGALSSTGLDAADLNNGRFDGATVEFYLVNWMDPGERVLLRVGTLGEVTRAGDSFRAEVRGPMQKLETVRGRVFAKSCDADLGDARCKVDLGPLTRTVTVIAGDGPAITVSGLEGVAAGWFAGGAGRVMTGGEAGARVSIARHEASGAGAVLTLRPLICGFASGDTLEVTPGCDKRFSTCREKFSNTVNFAGFPHLPGNDKALGYARGR